MALTYGQSDTISYEVISSQTLLGVTGDIANHTVKLITEDGESTPANFGLGAGKHFESTVAGVYKIVLTDDELAHGFVRLVVTSTTAYARALPLTLEISVPGSAAASGGAYSGYSTSCFFNLLADADSLANSMLNIRAYKTADDADRMSGLGQATDEINRGNRWQGRKFDPTQPHEFPRIPYPRNFAGWPGWDIGLPFAGSYGFGPDQVWDWDSVNLVAIVPQYVLQAVIIQADSILLGTRSDRLDKQFDGIKDVMTGALRQTYGGGHVDQPLCRRAYQLMQRYLLQTGALL